MKKLAILLLIALTQTQCLHRTKPSQAEAIPKSPGGNQSGGREPLSGTSLKLAGLPAPDLDIQPYRIGSHTVLAVMAQAELPGVHYRYRVCAGYSGTNCQSSVLLWGVQLVPNLAPGPYEVSVRACEGESSNCTREATHSYLQPTSSSTQLTALLEEAVRLTRDIRLEAGAIHAALAAYKAATFKDGPPKSEMDELVDTQLALGPFLTSEMINSPEFDVLYRRYGAAAADFALTDTPEGPSTADLNKRLDEMAAELDKLRVENSITGSPAQLGKTLGGGILLSFGSAAIASGILVGSLGFTVAMMTSDHAKRRAASEVNKHIDHAVDRIRHRFHKVEGSIVSMTPKDLKEEILDKETFKPTPDGKAESRYAEKVVDGRTFYTDRTTGKLGYVADGQSVYKVNSSLVQIPSDVGEIFTKPISDDAYRQLPKAYQSDFEPVGTDSASASQYRLKEIATDSYLTHEGNVYRKKWPEVIDKFPQLSDETLERLAKQYQLAKEDPLYAQKLAKESGAGVADIHREAWGRGVILLDKEGRLVEPPDPWKVDGQNWFKNESTIFEAKSATELKNPFAPDGPPFYLKDAVQKKYGFKVLGMQFHRPEILTADVVLLDAKRQAAQKVSSFFDAPDSGVRKANRYGKASIAGGLVLAMGGMVATGFGAAALKLGEGAGAEEELLTQLRAIERRIKSKHDERLKVMGRLQAVLGKAARPADPAEDLWLYSLWSGVDR